MRPPEARGEVSELVLQRLLGTSAAELDPAVAASAARRSSSMLEDDDVQLALFLLYELHYGGIAGVADELEWEPGVLAFRRELERAYEAELRELIPQPHATRDVPEALVALVEAADDGPGLSTWVERDATAEQVREVMVHRSIYTLKEADPHSWAIPRLHGRAKAALVEIQADEYGGGRPDRLHAEVFAKTMRTMGLDDRYGAYADHVPALVYSSMNLMSMFGLHRRLRGAIAGHLAAYEMTSSIPCKAYAAGLRRLGFDDDAVDYFDEHVEADAVHEQIAARDLGGGLADDEPALADDVLFGASACLTVDGRLWGSIRSAFEAGGTALRKPVPAAGEATP
ncbi:iron-containing redox enzyme family protein [Agromyces aerolatus]|uniref:iron-containing redox enzyme family protein n=1 Tax=Agromyces sp. LY-1074 TaxID=3074080 RepID=UPI00286111FD|nr:MULTISPECIES: iron-containing redox enzyme family protein [unclassified Agromyces]MDR5699155.1 iron-containing redox enzyme family protein [Agromyces sp. LY-1074]MDR5705450.1 iron-containing redox enzyme family protein [Agromyces sp. LY-1358]